MKKFTKGQWGLITIVCAILCIGVLAIALNCLNHEVQIMEDRAAQREEAKRAEEVLVVEEKPIVEAEIIEEKEIDIPEEPIEEVEIVEVTEPEVVVEEIIEEQIDTPQEVVEVEIMEEVAEVEPMEPYSGDCTEFYNYTQEDAIALAKMAYGEAGGVPDLKIGDQIISPKCQQAATMWTVLNRYDMGGMDSVYAVVVNPGAYHGYWESNPVTDDLLDLAIDVLNRWTRERLGETDVGRVLPAGYIYFGGDGTYNYFRNEYEGGTRWTWDYGDPYAE